MFNLKKYQKITLVIFIILVVVLVQFITHFIEKGTVVGNVIQDRKGLLRAIPEQISRTPPIEYCNGLDDDGDTLVDEDGPCRLDWTHLRIMYTEPQFDNTEHLAVLQQRRFNSFISNFGSFKYYDEEVLRRVQEGARYAKLHNMVYIPTIKFENTYLEPLHGFTTKGLYFNGVTLEDSLMIPPLDREYWAYISTIVSQIASLEQENPGLYRVDGILIDFEMYDIVLDGVVYDTEEEVPVYFSREGSYDTATFSEFVTHYGYGNLNPPVSEDARFTRRDWLINHNLLERYHTFVRTKATDVTRQMKEQVHQSNPNFFIGSYQSPQWSWQENRYLRELFIEFFQGWSRYTVPVLFGTDVWGGGDITSLPPELSKTTDGYFRFVPRDTFHPTIMVYYVPAFSIARITPDGPTDMFQGLYQISSYVNGYWYFTSLNVFNTCLEYPNDNYRIRVDCNNPALNWNNAPNCCYDEFRLPQNTWEEVCCPNWPEAYENLWEAMYMLNIRLDRRCGDGICDPGENVRTCSADCNCQLPGELCQPTDCDPRTDALCECKGDFDRDGYVTLDDVAKMDEFILDHNPSTFWIADTDGNRFVDKRDWEFMLYPLTANPLEMVCKRTPHEEVPYGKSSFDAPQGTVCRGDLTGDWRINIDDLNLFFTYLDEHTAEHFWQADVNGDRFVDLQDRTILIDNIVAQRQCE